MAEVDLIFEVARFLRGGFLERFGDVFARSFLSLASRDLEMNERF